MVGGLYVIGTLKVMMLYSAWGVTSRGRVVGVRLQYYTTADHSRKQCWKPLGSGFSSFLDCTCGILGTQWNLSTTTLGSQDCLSANQG